MNNIMNKKSILILNILLMIGITIFFLTINLNIQLMGEDFALIAYYPSNPPTSIIQLIKQIIERIINQATQWNIRLGEQLSIVFGSINIIIFQVSNSLISICYLLLMIIYILAEKIKLNKRFSITLILSFILTITFQPALGEIFFWRTGSTNYLWSMVILLLFGLPIRFLINNNDILKNKFLIATHTILGIFAGLTNENTGIVFIALYIEVICYYIIVKKKIPVWIFTSFIALCTGFIILFIAPSTAIRIQTYKDIFGIQEVTLKDYIYRLINVIKRFFIDNQALIVLLISSCIIYFICKKENLYHIFKEGKLLLSSSIQNIIMLLTASLSVGALIGAPYVETRAFFIANFFMIVCIITFCLEILDSHQNKFIYLLIFVLGMIFYMAIVQMKEIYSSYKEYNNFIRQREEKIELAKNEGNSRVDIEIYEKENNRILNTREEYIISNKNYVENYYNIKINYISQVEELIKKGLINETNDIIYGIEFTEYDTINDIIQIVGWGAVINQNAYKNNIKIILSSEENIYVFDPQINIRKDVAEYYNNSNYKNVGFYLRIDGINTNILRGNYRIGICIESQQDNYKHLVYTSNVLQIN